MAVLQPVQIEELPRSVEEFVALQSRVAQTPQGGAAMMVIALLLYTSDRELGERCLAAAVDQGRLEEGSGGFGGWRLRRADLRLIETQLERQPYIPHTYIKGTEAREKYRLPEPPYVLAFTDNPYSGDVETGRYKVFVECTGAAMPRPVRVRRGEDGLWRAEEWSSLVVGVRKTE